VTAEILVIAAIRIAGSLPVLRWPLAGGILAVLVDLSDLLLFPNVFELWFLLVAAVGPERVAGWSVPRYALSLALLTAAKEVQEWAIHGARLFDGISSVEFLDLLWRRLTGR
jgi:hypothetical protein